MRGKREEETGRSKNVVYAGDSILSLIHAADKQTNDDLRYFTKALTITLKFQDNHETYPLYEFWIQCRDTVYPFPG